MTHQLMAKPVISSSAGRGKRPRLVGAGQLLRVLSGEQARIIAGNGKPGRAAAEGFRHALEQPGGRHVEALVWREPIARHGSGIVAVEGGHQRCAGLVGMFGDAPDQRYGIERRRDQQLLALLQVETGRTVRRA